MLLRFDMQNCLNMLTECHSSHSAAANAIGPVNQAIKFNLAHLSMAGLLTEALCLRVQNEVKGLEEPQGAVMFIQRLN